ncbi:MAG: NAD-dependent epimerase/dehydratase family protein [Steroidobacteraceae bacterium]
MNATARTALIAGASGLVGTALVRELLDSPRYARVIALSRRPLPFEHPRFANRILDFSRLEEQVQSLRCDDAFCCLGTTLRNAGSRQQFRAVDHDLVLRFARVARQLGASTLVLVSSVGAKAGSRNFYLATKGETELAVEALRYASLHIMQPGLLLGARRERRSFEWLAQQVLGVVNPLLVLAQAPWQAIDAKQLALAMRQVALSGRRGMYRYAGQKLKQQAVRD